MTTSSPLSSDHADVPDLIPARILNEYVYCPRLAWLMWVEGLFADNEFTTDGRFAHRRVDLGGGKLPSPADADRSDNRHDDMEHNDDAHAGDDDADDALPARDTLAPGEELHARSVLLSSESERLIARMDLVEVDGPVATPVDYKRGSAPDVPDGAYDPERVQLCAQGLILRDNGFACDGGVLYFVASKQRVAIPFDEALIALTRQRAVALRAMAQGDAPPPPLADSPKCNGCSLAGICLPDETNLLRDEDATAASVDDAAPDALAPPADADADGPRRLWPARDDALPLYLQQHGLTVGKHGDELTVKEKGKVVATARLLGVSQVCLFGNISMTHSALTECCRRSIPVCHFSYGGWFYGMTTAIGARNAEVKRMQFRAAADPHRCLTLARRLVVSKIHNQRTLIRRNHPEPPQRALDDMARLAASAKEAASPEELLGIEGSAARQYFQSFPALLKSGDDATAQFAFEGRNRRPPRDPVNAMLSFLYALLAKDCTIALLAAGFDPFEGFYHRPRFGRPALALDLMEEFRPLVVDSTVLTLINTGVVKPGDFQRSASAVAMKPWARKRVIEGYERRMDSMVTHPVFGYRISYRRVLQVQARLLGRYLAGELPEFPGFEPR